MDPPDTLGDESFVYCRSCPLIQEGNVTTIGMFVNGVAKTNPYMEVISSVSLSKSLYNLSIIFFC